MEGKIWHWIGWKSYQRKYWSGFLKFINEGCNILGVWTATDAGIGAGVDSYFEYLAKGSLLLQRPLLMQHFNGIN